MEMHYCIVKNYRVAKRKESVVLLNAYNGACIELDEKSEEIFHFIQNRQPCIDEILDYTNEMGILPHEVKSLILCLKETGFIYES